ncbi:MAG: hypothetical protein GX801_02055 [Fibrobacter sp.]|nr:hypothetical protein [Fibrobacter sp.]
MFLRLLILSFLLLSCSIHDAGVVVGKAYDSSKKTVIDTASSFHLNDPIFLQVFNGSTAFETDTITLNIYRFHSPESKKLINSRPLVPGKKATDVVMRGPESNPLTARKLLRTGQAGDYLLEATSGDRIIGDQLINMYKGKK